jgi:regulator of replication initiation timing
MSKEQAPEEAEGIENPGGADEAPPVARGLFKLKQGLAHLLALARHLPGRTADAEGDETERLPLSFSLKQVVSIASGTLLVGALLGIWGGYRSFSTKLSTLTTESSTQRAKLESLKKENARMQREASEAQDNLAETQKMLKASQRSLAQATAARNAENGRERLPEGISSMPRNPGRGSIKKRETPEPTAPSGLCDVHASNPAEGLARCIEEFNRVDRGDR